MRIAAAESVASQLLGRRAVGLDQQRRKALRLGLIAEAVDEIFGRELVRGPGLVAQQIANRVVVLAVRQPPQFGLRPRLPEPRSFLLAIFQRTGQFDAGKLRQFLNPRFQDDFVLTARLDPLSARVRDAVGRLVEQQRAVRLLAVDQTSPATVQMPRSARAPRRVPESAGGWPMPRRPDCGRNGRQPSPSPDKGPLRKETPGPKQEIGQWQVKRNV